MSPVPIPPDLPPSQTPLPPTRSGPFWQNHKKLFVIITIVLLLVTVPATIYLAQNEQDTRSDASTNRKAKQNRPVSTTVSENSNDVDEIIFLLNQEDSDDINATKETIQEDDINSAIQDVEMISITTPTDE